jgi:hypothetical protein
MEAVNRAQGMTGEVKGSLSGKRAISTSAPGGTSGISEVPCKKSSSTLEARRNWRGGIYEQIREVMFLHRVRPEVFACVRAAVALGLTGVPVGRDQIPSVGNLRRVATGFLRRGEDVCDVI